jgi:hypothetical protein
MRRNWTEGNSRAVIGDRLKSVPNYGARIIFGPAAREEKNEHDY